MRFFALFALCFSIPALHGQSPNQAQIQKAVSASRGSENLSLDFFFNQPRYAPGDTVWFRPQTQPTVVTKKRNIYFRVGLADDKGEYVLNTIVKLNPESKTHYLALPDTLPPGPYRFIASTIAGEKNPIVLFESPFPLASEFYMDRAVPAVSIEGGHLIAGEENILLVETSGVVYDSVLIMNNSGATVARLRGLNPFWTVKLLPRASEDSFRVVSYYRGAKYLSDWLPVEPGKVSIHVLSVSSDKIELALHGDRLPVKFALLVNGAGVYSANEYHGNESKDNLLSMQGPLSPGMSEIVLLGENNDVLSRRMIFVDDKEPCQLEVSLGQNVIRPRQSAEVNLVVKTPSVHAIGGVAEQADIKLRVISERLLDRPALFDGFARAGKSPEEVNSILIGSTINYFAKERLTDPKTNLFLNFLIASGTVILRNSNEPAPDSTKISALLRDNLVNFEVTSRNGRLVTILPFDLIGNDWALYTAQYKRKMLDVVVHLENGLPELPERKMGQWIAGGKDWYFEYAALRKALVKSYSDLDPFAKSEGELSPDLNSEILEELDGPDVTLKLSDFKNFSTMAEVTRELLKAVELKRINGRDAVNIYTSHKRIDKSQPPLFVINGQLTMDAEKYFSIQPSTVQYIKVITEYSKLIRLGKLAYNGIIVVRTLGSKASEDKNQFEVKGLNPSAVPNTTNGFYENIPSLKPTLIWIPEMDRGMDEQIKMSIHGADDTGKYVVQVHVNTSKGSCYAEKVITIIP